MSLPAVLLFTFLTALLAMNLADASHTNQILFLCRELVLGALEPKDKQERKTGRHKTRDEMS